MDEGVRDRREGVGTVKPWKFINAVCALFMGVGSIRWAWIQAEANDKDRLWAFWLTLAAIHLVLWQFWYALKDCKPDAG